MLARILRFLAFAFVFAPTAFAADADLTLDPRVGLNAYVALVEQEFVDVRDSLRILAATENAASGDWGRIKGPLAILMNATPISAAVWFARTDGSYFTVDSGLTDQNIGDRDYFPALMAGNEVIGGLVISKSSGKRSVVIAVPVLDGGRVNGALGVSIALEKVAALVQDRISFPPQLMFYALDGHGQVALHRESSLLFEFAQQLGSPTLASAVTEMLAKPQGVVRYQFEGAQRTAIYKRSETTGWVYALRW